MRIKLRSHVHTGLVLRSLVLSTGVQLVFRTLNCELGMPNHNDDYLAVKMRDELLPFRCA